MKSNKDRKAYLDLMRECRHRLEALKDICFGNNTTTYIQTNIEFEALQIRKLLELIAFSSLISNQESYRKVRSDISSDWHAERILKKIETINPDFYPMPINGVINNKWKFVKSGFLTRKQFSKLYDECSAILHAENPFRKKSRRASSFHKKVPNVISKIELLISEHLITLAVGKTLLLVKVPSETGMPLTAAYLVSRNAE